MLLLKKGLFQGHKVRAEMDGSEEMPSSLACAIRRGEERERRNFLHLLLGYLAISAEEEENKN